MNAETVEALRTINNDFYRNQCDSFSETRKSPWFGWEKCLDIVMKEDPDTWHNFSVFDLACGNLRFEAFLAFKLAQADISVYATDNCDGLIPPTASVHYQNFDVLGALQDNVSLNEQIAAPRCDLSVAFGFIHHIPTQAYRQKILSSLIAQTRRGGYVIVSLWQFLNSASMAEKAQVTHACALKELGIPALDDNDYLLGWKNIPGAWRYCHSFSEAEIDQLVTSVAETATIVARFAADGRTGNLNSYVILQVR
ncbi:MAG: hypothetical protein RRX88_02530 [Raoultibacter sp.]